MTTVLILFWIVWKLNTVLLATTKNYKTFWIIRHHLFFKEKSIIDILGQDSRLNNLTISTITKEIDAFSKLYHIQRIFINLLIYSKNPHYTFNKQESEMVQLKTQRKSNALCWNWELRFAVLKVAVCCKPITKASCNLRKETENWILKRQVSDGTSEIQLRMQHSTVPFNHPFSYNGQTKGLQQKNFQNSGFVIKRKPEETDWKKLSDLKAAEIKVF